ncbi:hypothetical protein ADL35_11465, partial [Streptomyces sp. NRRL WC-3753]
AAVSSFGLSGTNVHTIVEQAPEEPATEPSAPPVPAGDPATLPPGVPVVLSARTPAALREQADRLAGHLAGRPDVPLVDLAHSLATTRGALEHRAAVLTGDRDGLLRALTALRGGTPDASLL